MTNLQGFDSNLTPEQWQALRGYPTHQDAAYRQIAEYVKLLGASAAAPGGGVPSADAPDARQGLEAPEPVRRVDEQTVAGGVRLLLEYKRGKSVLEQRIVRNEEWYRLRYNRVQGGSGERGPIDPHSAWLLNSLMNKHADMMDNMPVPAILPRERSDEETAQLLGEIIPVVLERAGFDEVYDRCSWYKLKNGTSCYGVFWDGSAEGGLGDIAVSRVDLLNLFWDPAVDDIQDSPNLFCVRQMEVDALKAQYPGVEITGDGGLALEQYIRDDAQEFSRRVLLVDWYYKRGGKLHLIKFASGKLLYATENDPTLQERGLYDHGKYPFVFDTLFPLEGLPYGFGFIDVMRDPQTYIDMLDQCILYNARLAGKPRWYISDSTGINEAEFADWSRDFVHVAGKVDEEHLRQITVNPLNGYIIQHREAKIAEMKETSANRDVSSGGTQSGVTAASAIAAMQEAGNKVSRDMLKSSYRAYRKVVELVIELIRQFYDMGRVFRVVAENGAAEYVSFSGQRMAFADRRPVFDIEVSPQKSNPFNRLSQNEFAKELYAAGVFQPEMADQALAMLDMMEFEGKQKVVEHVQQGRTMAMQLAQMQQVCAQMAQQIAGLTGQDPSGLLAAIGAQGQQGAPQKVGGSGSAGSSSGTSAQAYDHAASLAQGAEQRRLERSSPV